MNRLRWRLARLIAPEPIIHDPLVGKADGAYVLVRSGRVDVSMSLTKFRLRTKRHQAVNDRMFGDYERFFPSTRYVSGIVGHD